MRRLRGGAKARLLGYLVEHVGQVVTSEALRGVAQSSEWARRLRELRDEEGYTIHSHRDRADLKPGQYVLVSSTPSRAQRRNISKETRAYVLERDGYTCQMCGSAAADPDPLNGQRRVRLTMGHIVDKSRGGTDEADNLRAVCTNCNEGLQNIAPPRHELRELLALVRRAKLDDQRAVYAWLAQKFAARPPGNPDNDEGSA